MSCCFRHMKEEIEQAGITITKENKKEIDRAIHELVDVAYKDCSPTWKAVKEHIRKDPEAREAFIAALKKKVGDG